MKSRFALSQQTIARNCSTQTQKKFLFMVNLVDFNNNPYLLMKPLFLNVQLRTQIKSCGKFSMDESFNLVYVRLAYHYYLIHYFIQCCQFSEYFLVSDGCSYLAVFHTTRGYLYDIVLWNRNIIVEAIVQTRK